MCREPCLDHPATLVGSSLSKEAAVVFGDGDLRVGHVVVSRVISSGSLPALRITVVPEERAPGGAIARLISAGLSGMPLFSISFEAAPKTVVQKPRPLASQFHT